MLGFEFPQNFNFPYISRSFTEFWRRWHMTLGSWFREYMYIPMGGNRVSKPRMYFNLFVVWAFTGFWHGASWNFVLWGLFFFAFLVLEKAFLKPVLERHHVAAHFYVCLLLPLSWALFAITDFQQLGIFFQQLFSFQGGTDWLYYLRNYGVTFLAAIFFSTPVIKIWYERFICKHAWLKILLIGAVLVLSVAYLVDATYNPFLYFRF